jgi:hypothetical protein
MCHFACRALAPLEPCFSVQKKIYFQAWTLPWISTPAEIISEMVHERIAAAL